MLDTATSILFMAGLFGGHKSIEIGPCVYSNSYSYT